jgi:hypothetical protein
MLVLFQTERKTAGAAGCFPGWPKEGIMKQVLSFAAVAAMIALTAAPAAAKQDPSKLGCTQMQNGQCVAWNELTPEQARHVRMNDVFGPNYPYYMRLNELPMDIVRQYDLEPRSRYVATSNGYIFVVDPEGFEVTRVIEPERNDR